MTTERRDADRLWACTATGGQYFPSQSNQHDVNIEDIALSLSRICRFNGHLRRDVEMYSVAEHSVRVSYQCPAEYAFIGLLHDAHEAYLGDPIRPIHPLMGTRYWHAARDWQRSIALHVGLHARSLVTLPGSVKRADLVLLATERRDVCEHGDRGWDLKVEPLNTPITPMRSFDAYDAFCARYAELREQRERLKTVLVPGDVP